MAVRGSGHSPINAESRYGKFAVRDLLKGHHGALSMRLLIGGRPPHRRTVDRDAGSNGPPGEKRPRKNQSAKNELDQMARAQVPIISTAWLSGRAQAAKCHL